MDQFVHRICIHFPQEIDTIRFRGTGLQHEGFAQGVMAADEVFVAGVQALEIFEGGDLGEFADLAAIAVFAGEDEIPDAVEICAGSECLEYVGEEVVDIAEGTVFRRGLTVEGCFFRDEEEALRGDVLRVVFVFGEEIGQGIGGCADRDVIKTIEAFTFLVAVEGGAGGGDGFAAVFFRGDIEQVAHFGVVDFEEVGGDALGPGGLDESPARFGLAGEVVEKGRVPELEDLVGEDDFAGARAVVFGVEGDRQRAVVDDVESVDDVVEAVFHGGLEEGVAGGGAVVVGSAGVEEGAAAAGDLLGRVGDVLAEVSGKGIGELFECDFGLAGRRDLKKRLREGELIGCDISAE